MANLQVVRPLEIGTVLNEHYSLEEYVKRRAGWLGRLPDFPRATGTFAISRRDAFDIFGPDQALSVQEVRRRELAAEFDPLLPLPTTGNTESIDSFRSYGQREWSPSGDRAVSGNDTQTRRSPHMQPANIRQTMESDSPHRQTMESDSPQLPHHRDSNQSTRYPQVDSSPLAAIASTPATTPMSASVVPHLPQSNAFGSQADLLRSINARSGSPRARSPNSIHVNRNISSLAGRGMSVPVKHHPGKKRAAPDAPDATDSAIASPANDALSESSQPPPKRIKLIGPRDPSRSPSKAASPPEEAPTKRKIKHAPRQQSHTTKTTKSTTTSRTTSSAASRLDEIVAGARLPRNKDEARQAANVRHERLLEQHQAMAEPRSNQKRGQRSRTSGSDPDCLPEFFKTDNFADVDENGEEVESVRCTCGVVTDDKVDMLSCDECRVWQHIHCMGEAVPKNVDTGDYFCQMCDPWAHRKLLAILRKAQPLGE
ncbi:hypothetical protein LTR56_012232 [Elasticomyces elasticus]|nr:hypothetical protein LTR56_012232 [Elasticomyces elasticus]KAK3653033.1 hypothetical protein LTR22_011421 [Elasticomyces elasticus]KAK4919569.1 hypothetical protein LTR49_012789 [Elasticomyces elasticus]KAK5763109.1 hypothetical protein LTS12_006698 [Elasticomyces elasticus]